MDIIIAILSIIFSGITASMVTLCCQRKAEKRKYKMEVFQMIIAHRQGLGECGRNSGKFEEAVNQVFIAYNDSDKVLKAFEEFRSSVIYKNEKESNLVISNLLTLLKEMANELHIKYNFSNDDLFTKPIIIGK